MQYSGAPTVSIDTIRKVVRLGKKFSPMHWPEKSNRCSDCFFTFRALLYFWCFVVEKMEIKVLACFLENTLLILKILTETLVKMLVAPFRKPPVIFCKLFGKPEMMVKNYKYNFWKITVRWLAVGFFKGWIEISHYRWGAFRVWNSDAASCKITKIRTGKCFHRSSNNFKSIFLNN